MSTLRPGFPIGGAGPTLATYETTGCQYSKDNSFSITSRQGYKSVLTRYGGFYYLQPFRLYPATLILPGDMELKLNLTFHVNNYIVCVFKSSGMMLCNHLLTLLDVSVPVRPVNRTRPFSCGELILRPCSKRESGHARLGTRHYASIILSIMGQ